MSRVGPERFEEAYRTGDAPWDSGKVEAELVRQLDAGKLVGKTVLELGCGTGTDAVELARRGFTVTAVDLVPTAIERAKEKAARSGVRVDFRVADVLKDELGGPYDVVYDRGVYHVVRRLDVGAFQRQMAKVTRTGSTWLTLASNAKEENPPQGGPPRVSWEEIERELGGLFEFAEVKEVRLETKVADYRPLFWAVLMRRR